MSYLNCDFQLNIEKEGMEAYLQVQISPFSKQNHLLNRPNIISLLVKNGIHFGILESGIDTLIKNPQVGKVLIAQGSPSVKGSDAYFDLLLPAENLIYQEQIHNNPQFLESHSELPKTERLCVPKDTPLVKRYAATKGAPGCNIFGSVILGKKGAETPLPTLKNCYQDPHFPHIIRSSIKGIPLLNTDYQISVEPVNQINHHLEKSQIFKGITIIYGNIGKYIRVTSDSDLIIFGTIDASVVISKRGSIIVFGGIKGRYQGVLKAQHHLLLQFAEHATLEALGHIVLNEALHVFLIALKTIRVNLLMGSEAWAGYFMFFSRLGGDSIINCGFSPYLKSHLEINQSRIKKLNDEKSHYQKEQKKEISTVYQNHLKICLNSISIKQKALKRLQFDLKAIEKQESTPHIYITQAIDEGCFIQMGQFERTIKQSTDQATHLFMGKYGILKKPLLEEDYESNWY